MQALLGEIPGYDPDATRGDCWFDEKAARRALDFFPKALTHVKGEKARTPFKLEKWQTAIIGHLFGWKQKRKDGYRRYREAFIYVPRKNGKTALAAGIVCYVLFCDGEPGAEIYSAAADRDQAVLVYEQAKGMVLQNPKMNAAAKVYATSKAIVIGNSSYKAISAEANTKHGYNAHLVIVDELHAQPDAELVDVLETSMGSRRQPLLIHITTADFARESVCNEKLARAIDIRDGLIEDPSFLPVIYAADRESDWTDPKVWAKANPNLGVSLGEDYIRSKCAKAKQSSRFENTFKRLHLNIQTEQQVRWLSLEAWDRCGELSFTAEELRGRKCFAGMDLSSKVDLTNLSLLFPDSEVGYYLLQWYWVPKENARRRQEQDKIPYLDWIRQGHIIATDGEVVDYKAIRAKVNEIASLYDLQDAGFDPWNATQLATQLSDDDGIRMVEFRQGYRSMSNPSKQFEAEIISGRMHHLNSPVTRWMVSHVSVDEDPTENIKPTKPKSMKNKPIATKRIDGVIGAVIALGRALADESEEESVYEKRGVLVV